MPQKSHTSFHMLNHLVCGNFHHEEDDEACFDSPRKPRRNSFYRRHSKNNNPYSTRGLDQFSALLADLDKKRQQIYSQTRPQDISFVRFVSSKSTNDFVPIVVRVKKKDHKHRSGELKVRHDVISKREAMDESAVESSVSMEEKKQLQKAEKKSFYGSVKWDLWKRPSLCLSAVVILILVLLTVFGRSFATICTCVLWYMVTTFKDGSRSRKSTKKKHYVRGLSEKKMATHSGASEDKSARKLDRLKSW